MLYCCLGIVYSVYDTVVLAVFGISNMHFIHIFYT